MYNPNIGANAGANGGFNGGFNGEGFRLPPISFLSGGHNHRPIASSIQPADITDVNEPKNGSIFFKDRVASLSKDQRLTLPEPQALNIYPRRISAPGQVNTQVNAPDENQGVVTNTGSNGVIGRKLSYGKHHHHHHHSNQPHHRHHHHHQNLQSHNPQSQNPQSQNLQIQNLQIQDLPAQNHPNQNLQYQNLQIQDLQSQTHPNQNPQSQNTPKVLYDLTHEPRQILMHSRPVNTNIYSEGRGLGLHGASIQSTSDIYEERSIQAKRQKANVRDKIFDQIEKEFPERRHLGTIVYNPTTTWDTLQIDRLSGLLEHDRTTLLAAQEDFRERRAESSITDKPNYIPIIPPLSGAYINNFLEVKISYQYIKEFMNRLASGHAERTRELWGGYAGIYTDDSDLLYVLCHVGLFNDSLDLTECNRDWEPSDVTRPKSIQQDDEEVDLLDLSVTILLLPSLKKYQGFTRNGINSRSWTAESEHCGLSFGVYNVKWESFQMAGNDRGVHKKAAKEFIDDRNASEINYLQNNGWRLDEKYYETETQPTSL